MSKLVQKAIDVSRGKKPKKPGKKQIDPVLPDEEEIKRKTRRDAARRFGSGGSGRASTVLSDALGG